MAKRSKSLEKKIGEKSIPLKKGEKPRVKTFPMRGRRQKGSHQLKKAHNIGYCVAHSEALGSTSQYTDEDILKECKSAASIAGEIFNPDACLKAFAASSSRTVF